MAHIDDAYRSGDDRLYNSASRLTFICKANSCRSHSAADRTWLARPRVSNRVLVLGRDSSTWKKVELLDEANSFDYTVDGVTATLTSDPATGVTAIDQPVGSAGHGFLVSFVTGNGFSFDSLTIQTVPEPGNLAMLIIGLGGLGFTRRMLKA